MILAFGILAIAGMQVVSIKGNSFSKNLTQASLIAQERVEFLKSLDFIKETDTGGRLNTGDYNDIHRGIFQGRYRTEKNNEYVTIQYTVSWLERDVTHSVSLSTIRSR